MAPALNVKRKNINLPTDILHKLSIMAAAAGKSLKRYIEETMIDKANSTNIAVYDREVHLSADLRKRGEDLEGVF